MRSTLARVVLGLAAVIVVGGAIYLLREATMSTHYDTGDDSRLVVVVRAASNRAEEGVTLEQMATSQIALCGLEVARDAQVRTSPGADDRYVVTIVPALDSTDRKQYRGCLDDWNIDHLQLHVESMTDEAAEGDGGGGT